MSSSAALATKLPVRMWPVANAAACTPTTAVPSNAAQGTWAQISLTGANTLAVNASQMYCVRTQVTAGRQSLEDVGGDLVADASLSATLTGEGWTSAPATAVATQKTDDIYPLDRSVVPTGSISRWFSITSSASPNTCLDVERSGTGTPTPSNLISYGCSGNANQQFKLVPVNEIDPTLVTIAPKHTSGARLVALSNGIQAIEPASANSVAQRWYVQTTSQGAWQIVSAATGRCLSIAPGQTSAGPLVECNTTSAKLNLVRTPLKFQASGSNVTFTLGAVQNGESATLQRWTGTGWSFVTQTSTDSFGFSTLGWWPDDYQFRIVYSSSGVVMYQDISLRLPLFGTATPLTGFN